MSILVWLHVLVPSWTILRPTFICKRYYQYLLLINGPKHVAILGYLWLYMFLCFDRINHLILFCRCLRCIFVMSHSSSLFPVWWSCGWFSDWKVCVCCRRTWWITICTVHIPLEMTLRHILGLVTYCPVWWPAVRGRPLFPSPAANIVLLVNYSVSITAFLSFFLSFFHKYFFPFSFFFLFCYLLWFLRKKFWIDK
jgi:hypothetical protein